MHVELDGIGAKCDGLRERLDRILGRERAIAAVSYDRAGPGFQKRIQGD